MCSKKNECSQYGFMWKLCRCARGGECPATSSNVSISLIPTVRSLHFYLYPMALHHYLDFKCLFFIINRFHAELLTVIDL